MSSRQLLGGQGRGEAVPKTLHRLRHGKTVHGGIRRKLRAVALATLVVVSLLSVTTTGGLAGSAAATSPTEISDWNDLQNVSNDLSGDYVLVNDLNESTAGYDDVAGPTANGGDGFEPLGNLSVTRFTGTFDGNNHTISGLTINRSGTDYVGLFGAVDDPGYVKNVRLEGVEIEGNERVGALVGHTWGNTTNVHATGNVTGNSRFVGGLIGSSSDAVHNSSAAVSVQAGGGWAGGLIGGTSAVVVSDSHATGDVVSGSNKVGGLIGGADPAVVTNSYATGDVSGASEVGGLVGFGRDNITDSYATGNVSGTNLPSGGTGRYVGGLVGQFGFETINRSYATGHVYGENTHVGGLVGWNDRGSIVLSNATGGVEGRTNGFVGGLVGGNRGGSITRSYATGAVNNTGYAGGLVGSNAQYGTSGSIGSITSSYATGSVEAGNVAGGLVGQNDGGDIASSYAVGAITRATTRGGVVGDNTSGTVVDSYWDVSTTGESDGVGSGNNGSVAGLATRDMKGEAAKTNMTALDFAGTWDVFDNGTHISYPFLRTNTQDPAPGLEEPGDDADLVAAFDIQPAEPLTGEQVALNASASTDAVEYQWNSTDDPSINVTTTGAEITHTFQEAGTYDVTLTVIGADGSTDVTTQTVEVTASECFIATASFGTERAEEIDILRNFRDEVLLEHPAGELMVDIYYDNSPPVADWIAQSEDRRFVVREFFVKPLVEIISIGYGLTDRL